MDGSKRTIPLSINSPIFIFNFCADKLFLAMREAYQIRDQEISYFLTFQVVGWAGVFSTTRNYAELKGLIEVGYW